MIGHGAGRRLVLAGGIAMIMLAATYLAVSGEVVSWPTYQFSFNRTGLNPNEAMATGVAPAWNTQLDGEIYAQPLVAGSNAYVVTENNTVYGLDVNSGRINWQQHLGTPVPLSALPCGNIDQYGITSTPVIDQTNGVLYTVSMQSTPSIHHELYALNLRAGGAVMYHYGIDVPGSDHRAQRQRAALTLANGRVYVPFTGFDCGNYVGRVVGVKTGDSTGASIINYSLPNTAGGSIWAAASTDRNGNLYFATGNSHATGATPDRGESVVILSPTLTELDWFTAPEWQSLNINDLDLGSIGPVLLENGWILQSGKGGKGYLLNSANMGHVGGQMFEGQLCDPGGEEALGFGAYLPPSTVYIPCATVLKAVHVNTSGTPSFTVTDVRRGYCGCNDDPGVSPPVIAGGVLWNLDPGHKLLLGFNAQTAQQMFSQPLAGIPTHFAAPSVAGGHVFVPAGTIIEAFALSTTSTPPTPTPTATVPPKATYTTRATSSPNPVAQGQTVSITSTVTLGQAETDLIDVEVYDPSYNKVFQQFWDNQAFAAGQARSFTTTWDVPFDVATGTYTTMIGVYHQGWGDVKNFNNAAGTFGVAQGSAAAATYTSKSTVSPNPVKRGAAVSITSTVSVSQAETDLIDVEVYDQAYHKVFQQFWDNQDFAAGQPKSYTSTWSVPAGSTTGTYTVMIGVYHQGWGAAKNWNTNAALFTVQ
jgi:hypothetical protein